MKICAEPESVVVDVHVDVNVGGSLKTSTCRASKSDRVHDNGHD